MKTKKRTLAVVLAVAMLMTLLPTMAFAAETTVTINGTELTSGEPFECGEGTAIFDSANKTLTLNNATIEHTASSSGAYALRISGELKIILIGENKITNDN